MGKPVKRLMDVLLSIGILAAASPVMLIVALLIRYESGPPAIFRQTRIGRNGPPFQCYKFRTMRVGTAQVATHHAPANAITPLGAWLRKLKLDELPQLYNVITGDMSLVGPRPCLPSQTELIEIRRELGVMDARPGITGLAQVNNIDMSDPERLARKDAEYLKSATAWGDLMLLIGTFLGRGQGDRVKS